MAPNGSRQNALQKAVALPFFCHALPSGRVLATLSSSLLLSVLVAFPLPFTTRLDSGWRCPLFTCVAVFTRLPLDCEALRMVCGGTVASRRLWRSCVRGADFPTARKCPNLGRDSIARFPKLARRPFQQGISDSHSLLESDEKSVRAQILFIAPVELVPMSACLLWVYISHCAHTASCSHTCLGISQKGSPERCRFRVFPFFSVVFLFSVFCPFPLLFLFGCFFRVPIFSKFFRCLRFFSVFFRFIFRKTGRHRSRDPFLRNPDCLVILTKHVTCPTNVSCQPCC